MTGKAVGHADPGEIVGRSAGEHAHAVVLAITACADLAIFNQVLSLVMPLAEEWLVWLAVAGFTACSLTLAHFAGRSIRDAHMGHGRADRGLIWTLTGAWLVLGAAAFAVRLLVAEQGRAASTAEIVGGAILFLVLYVGSGAVAGAGAYLARNPLRDRFRKAQRDHRSALKALRRSQAPYERAVSVLQLHLRTRAREEANYSAARVLRTGYAEEMKYYTGILIAEHLQDPSATTGVTRPGRRPVRVPAEPSGRSA